MRASPLGGSYTVNASPSRNVWVRSPSGTDAQVTFFNDAVKIVALSDDGRVAINHKDRLYELGGTLPDQHHKWDKKLAAEKHGNAH